MITISMIDLDKLKQTFKQKKALIQKYPPRFLDFSSSIQELKSFLESIPESQINLPIFIKNILPGTRGEVNSLLTKLALLKEKIEKNDLLPILMVSSVDLFEYILQAKTKIDAESINTMFFFNNFCQDLSFFFRLKNAEHFNQFSELFSRFCLFFSLRPDNNRDIGIVLPDLSEIGKPDYKLKKGTPLHEVILFSKILHHLQKDHEFIPQKSLIDGFFSVQDGSLEFNCHEIKSLILFASLNHSNSLLNVLKELVEKGVNVFALFPLRKGRRARRREIEERGYEFFGDLFYRYRSPDAHAEVKDRHFFFVPFEIGSQIKAEIYIDELLDRFHDPIIKVNELVRVKRSFSFRGFQKNGSRFYMLVNSTDKTQQVRINMKGAGCLYTWNFLEGTITPLSVFSELGNISYFIDTFRPFELKMYELVAQPIKMHVTRANMIVETFNDKTGEIVGYSNTPTVYIGIENRYYRLNFDESLPVINFRERWLIKPITRKVKPWNRKTFNTVQNVYEATNTFELTSSQIKSHRYFLEFSGLATALDVAINDNFISSIIVPSSFVEITNNLKDGINKIAFRFPVENLDVSSPFKKVKIVPRHVINEKLDLDVLPDLF
ncbi:MAG: hypothetical protein ACXQS8_05980 [Candidatus Helarchaeales archaeon]